MKPIKCMTPNCDATEHDLIIFKVVKGTPLHEYVCKHCFKKHLEKIKHED